MDCEGLCLGSLSVLKVQWCSSFSFLRQHDISSKDLLLLDWMHHVRHTLQVSSARGSKAASESHWATAMFYCRQGVLLILHSLFWKVSVLFHLSREQNLNGFDHTRDHLASALVSVVLYILEVGRGTRHHLKSNSRRMSGWIFDCLLSRTAESLYILPTNIAWNNG